LGCIYLHGKGKLKPDIVEAMHYLEQAAISGHIQANHYLGMILSTGKDGILIDIKKAMEHFKVAASGGCGESMFNLAVLYKDGYENLLKKNEKLKLYYYKQAAQVGLGIIVWEYCMLKEKGF
jgi:TPR repeat protein